MYKKKKTYLKSTPTEDIEKACILESFIFSAIWKMKNENLCSIYIFFKFKNKK